MILMHRSVITVVSGLPRSGTSLMMKMLEAGGIPPLTDNLRAPDEDNPKGYYEFERVKKLKEDYAWLAEAKGRAVKVISALLMYLPAEYHYRVIFMRRAMAEILASQRQMLIRRGEPADAVSDAHMSALFEKHLQQVEAWLAVQPHIHVLYVNYNDLIAAPRAGAQRINEFLGGWLNVEAMAAAVDPTLHRQRARD
ncbi:MAG: sulfotransferase domain-containing protein [Anaerolineae bacterium]|nr:sulfotransferase [Thermoflexales bacterium]MDW8407717.1 sulfotransferase domain-containing protein [Anaerolineae bacterium]